MTTTVDLAHELSELEAEADQGMRGDPNPSGRVDHAPILVPVGVAEPTVGENPDPSSDFEPVIVLSTTDIKTEVDSKYPDITHVSGATTGVANGNQTLTHALTDNGHSVKASMPLVAPMINGHSTTVAAPLINGQSVNVAAPLVNGQSSPSTPPIAASTPPITASTPLITASTPPIAPAIGTTTKPTARPNPVVTRPKPPQTTAPNRVVLPARVKPVSNKPIVKTTVPAPSPAPKPISATPTVPVVIATTAPAGVVPAPIAPTNVRPVRSPAPKVEGKSITKAGGVVTPVRSAERPLQHVPIPSLGTLRVPQVMETEFLQLVLEMFRRPAEGLAWKPLITKVMSIDRSVLQGDTLRALIEPSIVWCKETVKVDPHHPNAAYLAFLEYLKSNLKEIQFQKDSLAVHFRAKGELSIPAVRQWVLDQKDKSKHPWDVCDANKPIRAFSEPVIFLVDPVLELTVSHSKGVPKMTNRGMIKRKGFIDAPLKLTGYYDEEYKRVQLDYKTGKPVLRLNVDGEPLIQRESNSVSLYVPYRSMLWVNVKAGGMFDVQELSIPDIGLSRMEPSIASNINGRGAPKMAPGSTSAVTTSYTTDQKSESTAEPRRPKNHLSKDHRRTRRSRTPSDSDASESTSGSEADIPVTRKSSRKEKTHKSDKSKMSSKTKEKSMLDRLRSAVGGDD